MLSTSQVVEVPLYLCYMRECCLILANLKPILTTIQNYMRFCSTNIITIMTHVILIVSVKIQYTFDKIPIALIPSIEPKGKPVFNLFSIPKNAIKVSLKGPTYFENLSTLFTEMGRQFGKSFTFYLDLPFFEALRLIFGWRICQFLYS